MHILYHHRTRGRSVEGIHIRSITDALRATGATVDIMSVPGADPYHEEIAGARPGVVTRVLRHVSARVPELLFELLEVAYNAVAYLRLTRYLKHQQVDLIYERYSLFLWAGVFVARRYGIPVILEINDSAAVDDRVRPLFFRRWARRIERWVFQHASGLVFVSGSFRDIAQTAYSRIAPAIVSPNAVDTGKFTPHPEARMEARRRYGLENPVVCGYVGAFIKWHGIDWFVRAIADVLPEHPRLAILLVGDGKLFDEVRRLVEARALQQSIILAGRVGHDEVPRLISAMDFAILPDSNNYGSPMKLFEFMGSGVAMVAPDFEPVREVITDGKTGWLFPAKDVSACVQKVIDVYQQPEICRGLGNAARDYIVANRQWSHNVAQLLALYEAIPKAPVAGAGAGNRSVRERH